MDGQALPLAVTYPRDEPDALMSARPGRAVGHQLIGIPTAINSSRVRHPWGRFVRCKAYNSVSKVRCGTSELSLLSSIVVDIHDVK